MGLGSYTTAAAATAPTAGQNLATLNVTGPGLYEVNMITYQTGTPDGKDANLQILTTSGGIVGPLLIGPLMATMKLRVVVGVGDAIVAQVVASATAGAVYNVWMGAFRIPFSVNQ